MDRVVICCSKPEYLPTGIRFSDAEVHVITSNCDLATISDLSPHWVFFPFWSYRIPASIYDSYQCVGFHTSRLPCFRGGSPIQNQILAGVYTSQICAFKITAGMDEGGVYMRVPIDLSTGSAHDIYKEISCNIFDMMIPSIMKYRPEAVPQVGTPTAHKRRKPQQSDIRFAPATVRGLYDFIRMLDAPGYPKAFIDTPHGCLVFSNADLTTGKLSVQVKPQDIGGSSASRR